MGRGRASWPSRRQKRYHGSRGENARGVVRKGGWKGGRCDSRTGGPYIYPRYSTVPSLYDDGDCACLRRGSPGRPARLPALLLCPRLPPRPPGIGDGRWAPPSDRPPARPRAANRSRPAPRTHGLAGLLARGRASRPPVPRGRTWHRSEGQAGRQAGACGAAKALSSTSTSASASASASFSALPSLSMRVRLHFTTLALRPLCAWHLCVQPVCMTS